MEITLCTYIFYTQIYIYIYISLGFGIGMRSGGFIGVGLLSGKFQGWVHWSWAFEWEISVGQMGCGGFEEWVFGNFRDECGGMLKSV